MRKITYLGPMPDPFAKPDGTRMTAEEWYAQRDALRDFVVDHEFGGMPPKPEFVTFTPLNTFHRGEICNWYRITAGTQQRQVSFTMELYLPQEADCPESGKAPVLLTCDLCYANLESDTVAEALKRGYAVAGFNRLELAADCPEVRSGRLYEVYPENKQFTAMSAWAWGFVACMDALTQLPWVDETQVGVTGHSRGGKTAMLAAVVDARIRYCCPNNSGCHGAVSHRTYVTDQGGQENVTERLGNMLDMFPHWMGEKLYAYRDREQDLPYDMHYFGALIAPRYYLQCEGQQDYWINPIGAWQNLMAVKACFKRLGCEDHVGGWFRPGTHRQKYPDFVQFMDFMDRARAGLPLSEHLQINPYPTVEKNFCWDD